MQTDDVINLRQAGKVKGGLYRVLALETVENVPFVQLASLRDGRLHTLRVADVEAGRLPLKPVKAEAQK